MDYRLYRTSLSGKGAFNMKRLLFFVFVILLAATNLYAEVGVTETEILLGMVNAQKGPAEGLGKGMLAGAMSVFNDVNAQGGINGRKIRLITADDGYEPDRTIDETIKMIETDKVFALFGYVGTPTANAAIPIVKETRVPLVGLFTGAMTLREPVTSEIINIRASYDDETEALVDYFTKNNNSKTFGVFYQDDGFGQAVLAGTEKALKKRGMEVMVRGTFQRNTLAVKTGLAKMLQVQPDVVVMVGPYTPIAEFISAARAEGLKSQLATVSFVGTTNLVDKIGISGDGVLISQVVPFPDDISLQITRECAEAIKRYYPSEKLGFVSFEGCITGKVMIAALEKAGSDLSRPKLIKVFEAMKDFDLGGIRINLGETDHQALDTIFLTQIHGGKIIKIK
jgi:ABC-type branched-subunit amino acid transport system substrate-binding protein